MPDFDAYAFLARIFGEEELICQPPRIPTGWAASHPPYRAQMEADQRFAASPGRKALRAGEVVLRVIDRDAPGPWELELLPVSWDWDFRWRRDGHLLLFNPSGRRRRFLVVSITRRLEPAARSVPLDEAIITVYGRTGYPARGKGGSGWTAFYDEVEPLAGIKVLLVGSPAFVALAGDEGLAGLALRLQRIEFLLEPLFGGFAGVDGAANPGVPPCAEAHWTRHRPALAPATALARVVRPKNRGPDQWASVIRSAIAVSDRIALALVLEPVCVDEDGVRVSAPLANQGRAGL